MRDTSEENLIKEINELENSETNDIDLLHENYDHFKRT